MLDEKELSKLTRLCRIACTEKEKKKFLDGLSRVINYCEQLQKIPTDDVPPCNHVLESIHNVMREDSVGETLPRETFLANAPAHIGGMIRVPPVIKFE